ncbi:unnamed protein product [Trichogramma brassicae]|uniref:RING-type domain-containing protein n=1 Tax=Trichogramma brassicae TaxID=86971 RepID=A0A6H5HWK8_9HYME|nr:unnamed protein product [Trichogramma brassicae]
MDKINLMIEQSTQEYQSYNWVKVKASSQTGKVYPSYRCHRCHRAGHWIKDCPMPSEVKRIKKSSGIPSSFMVQVEGPSVPGALLTSSGTYAVPSIDYKVYEETKREKSQLKRKKTTIEEPSTDVVQTPIPKEIICPICKEILNDAVMIACCAMTFCHECISTYLVESEDQQCPHCKEKDVSPEQCWPNRYLRKAVSRFNNETCCNNRWLNNSKAAHGTAPAIVTEKSCVSSSPATAEPSLISQSPMNSEKSSVEENEEGRLSIEHRAGTPMVDESQADPQQQLPMYSPGDERLTWSHHYYPSSVNSGPPMTPYYTYIAPQPEYAQQTPPPCHSYYDWARMYTQAPPTVHYGHPPVSHIPSGMCIQTQNYTASSEEQIAGEFLRKTIERDEHDRRLGEHRRARRDRSPPPPRYSDSTNGRVSSRWRSSRCTKRTASQSYGTSKRAKYSLCGVHARRSACIPKALRYNIKSRLELKCYMSKFRDAHVENRATNRRGSLLRLYNQRVLCALFYSVTSLTIA